MESAEADDEALAVVVEGAAKLMLSGVLTDETVRLASPSISPPLPVLTTHLHSATGPLAIRQALPLARYVRQPAPATVPQLLPPRVLLLLVRQPAQDPERLPADVALPARRGGGKRGRGCGRPQCCSDHGALPGLDGPSKISVRRSFCSSVVAAPGRL